MAQALFYSIAQTSYGCVALVWASATDIKRIYVPRKERELLSVLEKDFPGVEKRSLSPIKGFMNILVRLCEGENVQCAFGDYCDMSLRTPFQRKVLRTLRAVPRGHTISYQELARKAGYPKAVRAVASVMARNPFPLVYPCHRVIRSDGSIGGFQCGSALKRRLLKFESDRKRACQ